MTPNNLDMFKVKKANMHVIYTPKEQTGVRFALQWAVLELQPNFGKSAPNDPKWFWHVQGQKYPYAYCTHTRSPNFHPFRSTMGHFRVTAQYWEKHTKWPKNDLDMFKVKGTHIQSRYIHEAKTFVHFALGWAVFQLHTFFFRKGALNVPKWPWHVQGQKYQHVYCPFWSTMSYFWVTIQFCESASNEPKLTLTCSRSKVPIIGILNMHATYIPGAQIFALFTLRWAVFELQANFVKVVMGSYSMPFYCVPLFIALVGPYYMYHIWMILALNCILDSENLLVLENALKGFLCLLDY